MRKNKGKVYPSPSAAAAATATATAVASPFPATYSPGGDSLSVLKILPAAILAIAAVLSLEDREVLAYMITRSIKSTNPSSSSSLKNKKKWLNTHKSPVFDCECFDCYTSYWFKWDCSSNRELIHQAIEAFEDHLNNGEQLKKKGKKRDKIGHHRLAGKPETPTPEVQIHVHSLPELEAPPLEVNDPDEVLNDAEEEESQQPEPAAVETVGVAAAAAAAATATASHHKGLARTVLPDVLGLLNSRLWNLWSPNE